jgi:hypothetical protein
MQRAERDWRFFVISNKINFLPQRAQKLECTKRTKTRMHKKGEPAMGICPIVKSANTRHVSPAGLCEPKYYSIIPAFVFEYKTFVRKDKTFVFKDKTFVFKDKTFVFKDKAFVFKDKTFVFKDETFVFKDKTFVFKDKTFVFKDKTFVRKDKTFVFKDKTFVRKDKAFVFYPVKQQQSPGIYKSVQSGRQFKKKEYLCGVLKQ